MLGFRGRCACTAADVNTGAASVIAAKAYFQFAFFIVLRFSLSGDVLKCDRAVTS
jgi:hypothetical protein